MNFKSPYTLKTIPFPECINSCMCPDDCKTHCKDKVRDHDSINLTVAILFVVIGGCFLFLLMNTFVVN